MKSDEYIWKAFKNEKDDALSYIYHQNIDFLFFYGKKFTANEGLILDVIQDLFYDLIRTRKKLGETDNIRMYLLKSFRRRLINQIEKNKKYSELNKKFKPMPEIIFSIEEDLIYEEDRSEKDREITKGMQQLNEKQREILYYKFNCGFDYNQICEIMSISYDSARQMVSRSISLLKKYLTGKGFLFLFLLKKWGKSELKGL